MFTDKICLWESQAPEVSVKFWSKEDNLDGGGSG